MKSYLSCLFSLAFFFLALDSCTESYQLPNLDNQTTIVITGLITNEPGPYYVTVWENISNFSTGETKRRGINDARVTIIDSNGNVDELRSFYSVEKDSIKLEYGDNQFYYRYFYGIPDENGRVVKFFPGYPERKYDIREGRYFTTTTKGNAGQTYTLKVEYAGQEYVATDYMCYGTVIDSMSLEPIGMYIYDKPDGEDGFLVPCAYFKEPKGETNFYMFEVYPYPAWSFYPDDDILTSVGALKNLALKDNDISGMVSDGSPSWDISVINDRFLPSYVYQYKLSDGDSFTKYTNGTDVGFDWWSGHWGPEGFYTNMYCITEPVYRYYFALSQQYYQDGGVYSPSPASPPTNFSGGAQGCFLAASVSQYVSIIKSNK